MFFLSVFGDWGLLVLRLALGLIFLVHGWPKIKDLKTTASNFTAMGFRPGSFWGTLVALLEFFGGIALILGFYTQIAAGLFAIQFLVIIVWKMLGHQPFVGNIELDLLIFAAVLAILFVGAGELSLDKPLFFGGF